MDKDEKWEVYLDNNATTALAPEVREAVLPYLGERYGNPSSVHAKGIEAERAVKDSRRAIADILGASEREIVFTSGATESDNLALRGAAWAHARRGRHIIAPLIEHEAVLDTLHTLTDEGFTVSFIAPDANGIIQPERVIEALREDTILVAVMHVNNELGSINPIGDIARAVRRHSPQTLVFSDGAQAFGKLPVDLECIDLYAFSGHKIHGPKGIGGLYIRKGVKLKPQQTGGGQEFGYCAGTENVPGIVGMRTAVELAYNGLNEHRTHMRTVRDQLCAGIQEIENVHMNSPEDALETTVNAAFPGIPAEVLLHSLEERGIYVSSGSACSSKEQRASHVISALGAGEEVLHSTLRFGISRYTSTEDAAYVVEVLKEVVPELRKTVQKSS